MCHYFRNYYTLWKKTIHSSWFVLSLTCRQNWSTPTGKALEVKKCQNSRLWKNGFSPITFELKRYRNNCATIAFLASRHIETYAWWPKKVKIKILTQVKVMGQRSNLTLKGKIYHFLLVNGEIRQADVNNTWIPARNGGQKMFFMLQCYSAQMLTCDLK